MGAAAFEAGRLKCAVCGYSLRDLPAWHTCPECGVAYDPYSKVHAVKLTAGNLMRVVGNIWPVTVISLVFLPRVLVGGVHTWEFPVFAVLVLVQVVSLALDVRRLIRDIGGVCRVLVNHQGIRFEHPHGEPTQVSWQEFGSAHFGFVLGTLTIDDRQGWQLLGRRDRHFGTSRLRRELAEELNELAIVYTADRQNSAQRGSVGPAAFEAGRLKCPDCGYIVHGLPEWHACPECGLVYDPHSRVHKISRAGWYLYQLSLATLLVMAATVVLSTGALPAGEFATYLAVIAIISVPYLIGLIRCIGGPRRVLINHRGIRFEYPGDEALEISWSQFDGSWVGWFSRSLKIRDRRGGQVLRYRDRKIGTLGLRRKLAEEFNELARVYSEARGTTST